MKHFTAYECFSIQVCSPKTMFSYLWQVLSKLDLIFDYVDYINTKIFFMRRIKRYVYQTKLSSIKILISFHLVYKNKHFQKQILTVDINRDVKQKGDLSKKFNESIKMRRWRERSICRIYFVCTFNIPLYQNGKWDLVSQGK